MKKFFVIGTDTEVGKTYISTNLIKAYESQNIKTLCLKPVASGMDKNTRLCEDVANIIAAYKNKYTKEQINLISFKEAVAPHILAAKMNKNISLEDLKSFVEKNYRDNFDAIFIEGAGGLLTPYSNKITQFDLIKQLNIPVLLISSIKVGCINHTLLTINELEKYNIKILGWIANCNYKTQYIDEQIETIEKLSKIKCLKKINKDASYTDFIELSKILISPDEKEKVS